MPIFKRPNVLTALLEYIDLGWAPCLYYILLVHFILSLAVVAIYVTGPAKIGHICTNLALILNFNLQYLLKYEYYDNEIFMPYSHINKQVNKSYRT